MGLMKTGRTTLPETNSSHLKLGHPKRKLVFQPCIFRGEVLLVSGRVETLRNCLVPWEAVQSVRQNGFRSRFDKLGPMCNENSMCLMYVFLTKTKLVKSQKHRTTLYSDDQ